MVERQLTIDKSYFNDLAKPKPAIRHAETFNPKKNNLDLLSVSTSKEAVITFADPVVKKRGDRLNETSKDRKDRAYQVLDDTERIKSKANLLEEEVKSMRTKMHRIESLVRKRDKGSDNYLLEEFESIKAKNARAKERIQNLNVAFRGLQARPSTAGRSNKYDHIPGKLQKFGKSYEALNN